MHPCRTRRLASLPALAVLLAAAAVATASASDDGGELVVFDRYGILPRTATIEAGGEVTFRFRESATLIDEMQPLRIVFEDDDSDDPMRSPPLRASEEWILRFDEPGLYRYHLEEHRDIEGAVIVE